MIQLEKLDYSEDYGGEVAVKRPSPLPLLWTNTPKLLFWTGWMSLEWREA
jgi:hypothetical protein